MSNNRNNVQAGLGLILDITELTAEVIAGRYSHNE